MYKSEISLKAFIFILVKAWKWVFGASLAFFLASVLITTLLNSTSYEASLTGFLKKADVYETKFGTFKTDLIKDIELINSVKNKEFLTHIIQDDLPISISTSLLETGEFTITLHSNDTKSLDSLSTSIIESLEDYINFNLQTEASEYFKAFSLVALDQAHDTLEDNAELIALLTQKIDSIERLITPNIINPEYEVLSTHRASLEYETIRSQFVINKNTLIQNQLNRYLSFDFDDYKANNENIAGLKVSLEFNTTGTIQEQSLFSPLAFISFSTIMGALLSIFVVYFLHYWKNN